MKRDIGNLTGREHELLVVGGGIHGAAAAWDAAQRGLGTALVEARDFGAGASWNSLKTIHGGLRYLQTLDLRRLRESVRERRTLLRIAPELVRPLAFVVPIYGHGVKGREAFAAGLRLYDWLSRDRNDGVGKDRRIPGSRLVSVDELRERVPGAPPLGLSGGAVWWDAQVSSSERLTMAFVLAAADAGAAVANHTEVVGLLRDGSRVGGALVRDGLTGDDFEVRARLVLNAAGPGADEVLRRGGLSRASLPLVRAFNLVLTRPVVAGHAVGGSSEGRFLFLVPWRDRALLGTDYAPADTLAGPTDVERMLAKAVRAFPWAGLARGDVALVHRGHVPATAADGQPLTRPLVVDHQRADGVPGLVTAVGVKYTTARAVAEHAVDLAVARLGARAAPCRTSVTPLVHARPMVGELAERARAAVEGEMACTLTDAMLRRLDLGTEGPPGAADVEIVAGVMAGELGWSPARQAEEVRSLLETYRA
ncbi:MAG TPA: FAD-dependent oxidoreductase [Vicinamibacteria bacterium]|nr:FAD-dependent oxidoreductase [Vicinamibacteria bacterium]